MKNSTFRFSLGRFNFSALVVLVTLGVGVCIGQNTIPWPSRPLPVTNDKRCNMNGTAVCTDFSCLGCSYNCNGTACLSNELQGTRGYGDFCTLLQPSSACVIVSDYPICAWMLFSDRWCTANVEHVPIAVDN